MAAPTNFLGAHRTVLCSPRVAQWRPVKSVRRLYAHNLTLKAEGIVEVCTIDGGVIVTAVLTDIGVSAV